MSDQSNKTILELFSGQKTISNYFETLSWSAVTVDNNPKLNPSICCDILKLKRSDLPDTIDFLWASPVCTLLSRAAAQHHWEKVTLKYRQYIHIPLTPEAVHSLALLQKTIDIINWFPGVPFIIENPIGRIQHSAALKSLGHFRYFVNYFDFGKPYSKETYLFSNQWLPFSLKKYSVIAPGLRTVRNVEKRSSVPVLLIEEIYKYLFYGTD